MSKTVEYKLHDGHQWFSVVGTANSASCHYIVDSLISTYPNGILNDIDKTKKFIADIDDLFSVVNNDYWLGQHAYFINKKEELILFSTRGERSTETFANALCDYLKDNDYFLVEYSIDKNKKTIDLKFFDMTDKTYNISTLYFIKSIGYRFVY